MSAWTMTAAALQTISDPNQFNNYLLLGYAVMWLIVMVYIASLAVRQRNLRRDLDLMEEILQEDDRLDA
ncbi:MAG: CcmD family protein [Candidatus Promineifilaceae bacterium]|jgi:CcmD family protein